MSSEATSIWLHRFAEDYDQGTIFNKYRYTNRSLSIKNESNGFSRHVCQSLLKIKRGI